MKDITYKIIRNRYGQKDFKTGERLRLYFNYGDSEPVMPIIEGVVLDNNRKRAGQEAIQLYAQKIGVILNWGPLEGFSLEKVSYKQTYMINNIGLVEELNKTKWIIREPKR